MKNKKSFRIDRTSAGLMALSLGIAFMMQSAGGPLQAFSLSMPSLRDLFTAEPMPAAIAPVPSAWNGEGTPPWMMENSVGNPPAGRLEGRDFANEQMMGGVPQDMLQQDIFGSISPSGQMMPPWQGDNSIHQSGDTCTAADQTALAALRQAIAALEFECSTSVSVYTCEGSEARQTGCLGGPNENGCTDGQSCKQNPNNGRYCTCAD